MPVQLVVLPLRLLSFFVNPNGFSSLPPPWFFTTRSTEKSDNREERRAQRFFVQDPRFLLIFLGGLGAPLAVPSMPASPPILLTPASLADIISLNNKPTVGLTFGLMLCHVPSKKTNIPQDGTRSSISAQRLIYTKGYEKMAIRDILDELNISKGAFYHYFDLKGALLEALVGRLLDEAEKLLNPVVQDPGLSALDKLERYFATAARWKTDRKDYLMALVRIWYADENAIVRQKIFAMTVERIAPIISAIIRQGIREGVINTPYPDQAGELFPVPLANPGGFLLQDAPGARSELCLCREHRGCPYGCNGALSWAPPAGPCV